MITKNTIVDFAGAAGEPTLYKHFNEAVELLIQAHVAKIVIHTNAIYYSKIIEYGISTGIIEIVVSIDAGTKRVHQLIKQVETFDTVWKNIKNYAKAKTPLADNNIVTKYIIVPDINDNIEEIEKWAMKSKESGVTKLILNADDRIYCHEVDEAYQEKLIKLTDSFVDFANKYHLRYCLYYGVYLPYRNMSPKLGCVFPQYKEINTPFEDD